MIKDYEEAVAEGLISESLKALVAEHDVSEQQRTYESLKALVEAEKRQQETAQCEGCKYDISVPQSRWFKSMNGPSVPQILEINPSCPVHGQQIKEQKS